MNYICVAGDGAQCNLPLGGLLGGLSEEITNVLDFTAHKLAFIIFEVTKRNSQE